MALGSPVFILLLLAPCCSFSLASSNVTPRASNVKTGESGLLAEFVASSEKMGVKSEASRSLPVSAEVEKSRADLVSHLRRLLLPWPTPFSRVSDTSLKSRREKRVAGPGPRLSRPTRPTRHVEYEPGSKSIDDQLRKKMEEEANYDDDFFAEYDMLNETREELYESIEANVDYLLSEIEYLNQTHRLLLQDLMDRITVLEALLGTRLASETGTHGNKGDLRLLNSQGLPSADKEGFLQIHTGWNWGYVCDDYFNMEALLVSCRQMEHQFDLQTKKMPASGTPWSLPWMSRYNVALDDVHCSGEETRLEDCRHLDYGVHDCSPSEAIYVNCY